MPYTECGAPTAADATPATITGQPAISSGWTPVITVVPPPPPLPQPPTVAKQSATVVKKGRDPRSE